MGLIVGGRYSVRLLAKLGGESVDQKPQSDQDQHAHADHGGFDELHSVPLHAERRRRTQPEKLRAVTETSAGLTFEVDAAQDGRRLDQGLAAHAADYSRSRLKRLILDGAVTVDGVLIANPARKLRRGQEISLEPPPPEEMELAPEAIPLDVVFEDDAYLIVDKPAGLVVHPGAGHPSGTLVNALLHHCGPSLQGIGGVRRPGIVHRLDKDTSGLLVVAKTQAMHAALVELFAAHAIHRVYTALVYGVPNPPEGRLETAIGRAPQDRKRMAVVKDGAGRRAVTNYRTENLFQNGAASQIACRLETGRTHQIRVHMTHLGHPLIGDPVYGRATPARLNALGPGGRDAVSGFNRQALHARSLGFTRPDSGETVRYESAIPGDLTALIQALDAHQ